MGSTCSAGIFSAQRTLPLPPPLEESKASPIAVAAVAVTINPLHPSDEGADAFDWSPGMFCRGDHRELAALGWSCTGNQVQHMGMGLWWRRRKKPWVGACCIANNAFGVRSGEHSDCCANKRNDPFYKGTL